MVWSAGQSIQGGRYLIQEVLGQGGFGITYKALHVRLKQPRVIKTPNLYLTHDPDYQKYVDRFTQEGQRLAELTSDPHPHIVRAWDLFEEGNIPCLVMDFVPGETLSQLVKRRGALPEAEIVPCIHQIGDALSFIHQAGLVHRDAHPGNIIIRSDRKAILIDFGIAKDLIPSTHSTKGEVGNLGFAPYEQLFGGSRKPTVDIYCLAATLYFAVTGKHPATSLDRKLHSTALIAPRRVNPEITALLNQAILKGMALEAGDRPQSMQAWLQTIVPPDKPPKVTPSSAAPNSSPTPTSSKNNPPTTRRRRHLSKVPWGWLGRVVSCDLILGGVLGFASAPPRVWALTLAGTVASALFVVSAELAAESAARAVVVPVTVLVIPAAVVVVTWFLASLVLTGPLAASAVSLAGLAVVAGILFGTGYAFIGAVLEAGRELLESFNTWQTLLILLGTSVGGLGLGWAIRLTLRSNGFHPIGML